MEKKLEEREQLELNIDDTESYIFSFIEGHEPYNDYFGYLYLMSITFTSGNILMFIVLCLVIYYDPVPYIAHIPWIPIISIYLFGLLIFIIYFVYYYLFKVNYKHNNKILILIIFLLNYFILVPFPLISDIWWLLLAQNIKKRYKETESTDLNHCDFAQIILWSIYKFIADDQSLTESIYRLQTIYRYFHNHSKQCLYDDYAQTDKDTMILFEKYQFKFHCMIIIFIQSMIIQIMTQLLPIYLSHHIYGYNVVIMVVFTFWDCLCIIGFIWMYSKFNWNVLLWLDNIIQTYPKMIKYLKHKPKHSIYDEIATSHCYAFCRKYLHQLFTEDIVGIILLFIRNKQRGCSV